MPSCFFGLTGFSCTLRINTAANYTVGLQLPFLTFLEGKALLNSEVLHKAGSPESWNCRVQQRNESSESCPHSASSQGFSESSRADTGQAQPRGTAWNIFTGRFARCLWFNPALRNHTTLVCFSPFPSSCWRAQQGTAAKAERLKSGCAACSKHNFLTLLIPAPSQGPKPSIC